MKLRIDLLRHGETRLSHTLRGSTDDELTELGWQQMQQTVSQQFMIHDQSSIHSPWDLVFSSPLQRCFKFAEYLALDLKIPLVQDQRLQEMHFGDWEAIPTQQIYEEDPELLANFWQLPTQFSPPNAEKLIHFQDRILKALEHITLKMNQPQQQNALIVTHGGVIKLLKCIALQHSLDDILKMSAELGQLNQFVLDSETMKLDWVGDDQ